MSTSQQQMDTSLGELAATAAISGCPVDDVQRMCEASEFTRGLNPEEIVGAIGDSIGGVGCQVNAFVGLVADVAGATEGLGEGILGRGACAAGQDLQTHSVQLDDAVDSVRSCAVALDALSAGCAEAVGALAANVVGLVESAISGGAEVAGDVVHEAVRTVTGMLDQRNCGLESLVDAAVSTCARAADSGQLNSGVAISAGATLTVDASVSFELGSASDVTMDCRVEAGVEEPHGADPLRAGTETSAEAATPSGPNEAVASESFDDVVASAPVEIPEEAGHGETPEVLAATSSDEAWNPDIWTTSAVW